MKSNESVISQYAMNHSFWHFHYRSCSIRQCSTKILVAKLILVDSKLYKPTFFFIFLPTGNLYINWSLHNISHSMIQTEVWNGTRKQDVYGLADIYLDLPAKM